MFESYIDNILSILAVTGTRKNDASFHSAKTFVKTSHIFAVYSKQMYHEIVE